MSDLKPPPAYDRLLKSIKGQQGNKMENFGIGGWMATGAIGGVLIGFLSSIWGKVKEFVWRICRHFIECAEINGGYIHNPVLNYLCREYKRSKFDVKNYCASAEFNKDNQFGLIPYENLAGRDIIFWKGWKPLYYTKTKKDKNSPASNEDALLYFLRGTFNVEKIVNAATKERN